MAEMRGIRGVLRVLRVLGVARAHERRATNGDMKIRKEVPLSAVSTLRIGGVAGFFGWCIPEQSAQAYSVL